MLKLQSRFERFLLCETLVARASLKTKTVSPRLPRRENEAGSSTYSLIM